MVARFWNENRVLFFVEGVKAIVKVTLVLNTIKLIIN